MITALSVGLCSASKAPSIKSKSTAFPTGLPRSPCCEQVNQLPSYSLLSLPGPTSNAQHLHQVAGSLGLQKQKQSSIPRYPPRHLTGCGSPAGDRALLIWDSHGGVKSSPREISAHPTWQSTESASHWRVTWMHSVPQKCLVETSNSTHTCCASSGAPRGD